MSVLLECFLVEYFFLHFFSGRIGSSEEVEDIKSAYLDFEGDVDQMLESVLCCSWEDVPR